MPARLALSADPAERRFYSAWTLTMRAWATAGFDPRFRTANAVPRSPETCTARNAARRTAEGDPMLVDAIATTDAIAPTIATPEATALHGRNTHTLTMRSTDGPPRHAALARAKTA